MKIEAIRLVCWPPLNSLALTDGPLISMPGGTGALTSACSRSSLIGSGRGFEEEEIGSSPRGFEVDHKRVFLSIKPLGDSIIISIPPSFRTDEIDAS